MQLNVSDFCPNLDNRDFIIIGTSYIGNPRSNTAMFITKKVERLLPALNEVKECLVFAEEGVSPAAELMEKHAFAFSRKPQLEYARFATIFAEERAKQEKTLCFNLTDGGYYLCEDSTIEEGEFIEPCCVIGPDVRIGKNARIMAGAIIKRATIGDNVLINEHSVIGANGFTMAEDEEGNKFRIPTLGRVLIGNDVEIGAHDNISCGSGGNTILEDNVKIDALVHIGHDVHLHKNVEITAGATIGGFVDAEEKTYVGVGAVMRNRINIGKHAFIGMGANVTKSVDASIVVAGNPAKPFERQSK